MCGDIAEGGIVMTVRQKVLGLLVQAPAGLNDAALAAATGQSHRRSMAAVANCIVWR